MRTAWICLLAVAAVCGPVAAAEPKIAVIDMESLVRLHPNTAADKKLLEQTLKEFNAQKAQLQDEAEATRKAFEAAVKEAQDPALGDQARQRKEQEAMEKREAAMKADRAYGETTRGLQRQLTEQEVRMLKRTTGEIETAVRAYATEQGLDLVLQLPGEKLGAISGVVFAKPQLDITPAIMQRLGIKPDAATNALPGEAEAPLTTGAAP